MIDVNSIDLPDRDEGDVLNNLPDKGSKLSDIHYQSRKINPDEFAETQRIARKLKENETFVRENIQDARKILNSPTDPYWMQFEKDYPKATEFLTDPRNMAIAQDDYENLSKLETKINEASFISNVFNSASYGAATQLNAGLARLPGLVYDLAALPQNALADNFESFKSLSTNSNQVPGLKQLNDYAKEYVDRNESLKPKDYDGNILKNIKEGNLSDAFKQGVYSTAMSAPSMLASIGLGVAGAASVGAGLSGVTSAANTSQDTLDSGASNSQRILNAGLSGGAEFIGERFGTLGFFDNPARSGLTNLIRQSSKNEIAKTFAKGFAKESFTEGSEELLTEGLQATSAQFTGVDQSALANLPENAINSFLGGAFSGGVITSPSASLYAIKQARDSKKIEMLNKSYEAIGEVVKESKLQTRDPEIQEQFIQKATEGTPIENAFVNAEDFQEYFQSKGLDPAQIAEKIGALEDFKEAIETNGSMKIPLSKWATNFAQTEHYAGLKDSVKFSESDLTPKEIKTLGDSISKELLRIDQVENEDLQAELNNKADYEFIKNSIYESLIKKGIPQDQAIKNSKIEAESFVAASTAREMNARKLFEERGYTLEKESFQRKPIPVFESNDIVGEDQVSKAIDELGLPEAYKNKESLSAIRSMIASMRDEINEAQAGSRFYKPSETGGGVDVGGVESTFPSWFRSTQFKTKDAFNKVASKGNSKMVKDLVELAIGNLKNGRGDNGKLGFKYASAPDLNFVSLVDPDNVQSALDTSEEFSRYFSEQVSKEYFQDKKEINDFIINDLGMKNVLLTSGDTPAIEFDPITNLVSVNAEKIKTKSQLSNALSKFGTTKSPSIEGTLDVTINGEDLQIDAGKYSRELARKLNNLSKLAECMRG